MTPRQKKGKRREGDVPSYNAKNRKGFTPLFCTDSAKVQSIGRSLTLILYQKSIALI